jgi:hypothetical protein
VVARQIRLHQGLVAPRIAALGHVAWETRGGSAAYTPFESRVRDHESTTIRGDLPPSDFRPGSHSGIVSVGEEGWGR